MEKKEILEVLNNYNFDKNRTLILSGAALVLYGVKNMTGDIDLAFEQDYYKEITQKFASSLKKDNYGDGTFYIDKVINFGKSYYTNDFSLIDGFRCQSLQDIINLKKKLNREKDQKDIELINKFCKKQKIKIN